MSIKRTLIKNTGFNLAGYIFLLAASFFSISVLLKNLGRDIFGVYLLLASFVTLASVFDFGISTAVIRKLSLPTASRKDKVKTWKTSFGLFIVIGIILSLIFLGIMIYVTSSLSMFNIIDRGVLNWTIFFLTITIFVNHLNSHFLSLPQAEQRFDVFNSKTLLVGSANTILSAFLSSLYPNILYIFILQFAAHLITHLFMIRYALKIFPGNDFYPDIDREERQDLIKYGLKNFIGTLANQVEAQYSKYALGAMVSAGAITAYTIPQNIVAKGAGIVSQVAQAFFPLGTSLLEKTRIEKLRKLIIGIEVFTFIGGLLAIFLSIVIGRSFLMWWLKDPVVVDMATPILKIMSVYFLLTALTPIPTVVLQSTGKPQIPSLFAVITAVLNIASMYYFIPRYHALGAAYATLFSSSITVPALLIVFAIQFRAEVKKTQSQA